MSEPRCERSDLLVSQCAHCRPKPTPTDPFAQPSDTPPPYFARRHEDDDGKYIDDLVEEATWD